MTRGPVRQGDLFAVRADGRRLKRLAFAFYRQRGALADHELAVLIGRGVVETAKVRWQWAEAGLVGIAPDNRTTTPQGEPALRWALTETGLRQATTPKGRTR